MNLLRILRKRPERLTRKAVYTFVFGDYDELKPPKIVTPGWDYVCFTDDASLRSDVWDVRLSPRTAEDRLLDNKRFASKHTILPHQYLPGYDLSLSLGAQLELNCNLDSLMQKHFRAGDDMMICYWERECVYDEAEWCKRRLRDEPARIDAQMQRYHAEGYPARNGLYMGGIIARWHERASVQAMCDLWWDEYCRGSRRDQLSLTYAIWKSEPIKISALDYGEQFFEQRNFITHPHKRCIDFGGAKVKFDTSAASETTRRSWPGRHYVGHVDAVHCDRIVGWAADRARLNASIHVSLYDGGSLIATAPADLARPDVGAYLGDDGRHGFSIPVPADLKDGAAHEISVRFEATDINLIVNARLVSGDN